jgi:ABC-type Fe3+-hydroxamate transport system substrate-binding protein
MKKVSFFLSALALVAFAACNNTAEEAVVEPTVDTTVVDEAVTEDTTPVEATEEVAAEGEEAAAE